MKHKPLLTLAGALVMAAFPTVSSAQWLQHTTTNTGTALTAVFPGASGAYTGNVVTTASNITDGGNDGVPAIVPQSFTNLTPSFAGYGYTTNAGAFDYFGVTYNNSQDAYHVSIDFTGLANGYLPAGTVMGVLDVNILENILHMQAFDPSSSQITSSWLNALPGSLGSPGPGYFDYNNAGGDSSLSITGPVTSAVSGTYDWLGTAINDDSLFLGYVTTQNIRNIEFDFSKSNNQQGLPGGGGYGIAFQAVPEPFSMAAFGVGLLAVARRRRRDRS